MQVMTPEHVLDLVDDKGVTTSLRNRGTTSVSQEPLFHRYQRGDAKNDDLRFGFERRLKLGKCPRLTPDVGFLLIEPDDFVRAPISWCSVSWIGTVFHGDPS